MMSFGFETRGEDVVKAYSKQIEGKTIVITGASAKGLGAHAATTLAAGKPEHIVLLARSASKVQSVIDEITKITSDTKAFFIPVSLDDLDSVRKAAAEIVKQLGGDSAKIDVLVNNAGIMAVPYSKSKQGYEAQFATNHLGHFLLTQRLMPYIKAAGKHARVINLTSDGYKIGPFRPDDVNFDDGKAYNPWSGYAQSKTANILFSRGLALRGITSFAVHPGVIFGTNLANGLDHSIFNSLDEVSRQNTGEGFVMEKPKTIEQGVATTIVAAFAPEIANQSGSYLADCQLSDVKAHAKDPEAVQKLWELSEQFVGERFAP